MTTDAGSGSGSGSALPSTVLITSGVCTLVAVAVSGISIYLQLKNYRKPQLQRMVVRIMLMIPIYAIASLISLFSLEAAFVIDAIRDIYEAFVIYCFFSLLLSYLGGERSLLILLHGRPPKRPPFPISLFKHELDVSDPHTFLFIKRGIIQYVQIKPALAAATLLLKAFGKYNEGDFRANSGYLYVSIIYNISICLALYCLAMFWLCVSEDLKPFRPVPKFLCIKGILFFSFWQSILISILVAASIIDRLGPYTDAEHISVGLNDTLICIEMPFFALAHLYAFSYTDFIDSNLHFCARMPIRYAFMDAFGIKDVAEDIKTTLRGEGMDYREYEPAEGGIHQGLGRDRRIKAGLRYSKGGKKKYWLPRVVQNEATSSSRRFGRHDHDDIHAPLLGRQADSVVHLAPDMLSARDGESLEDPLVWDPVHQHQDDDEEQHGYELPFGDVDPGDEALFEHSRQYVFGDYNYPVIDVSDEGARVSMWHEEERVLRDERGAWESPIRNVQVGIKGKVWEGYGAIGNTVNKLGGVEDETSVKLRWNRSSSLLRASPDIQRARGSSVGSRTEGKHGSSGVASTSTQGRSSSRTSVASPTPPPIQRMTSTPRPSRPSSKSGAKNATRSPPLPPDAVDLVVEDVEAGMSDRRKIAEPRFRKGLDMIEGIRKVYRRGVSLSQDDARDEEEDLVAGKAGESVVQGERMRDSDEVWDRDYEAPPASPPRSPTREQPTLDGIVVVSGSPPAHVRMAYEEVEDHNPWA